MPERDARGDTESALTASSLRAPLTVLATLAVFAVLYFAGPMIVPVVLALFFAIVLSPAVEALQRLRVPSLVAAGLVMLLLAGALALLVDATVEPAQEWVERVPRILSDLDRKVRPLRRMAGKIDEVAIQASRVTGTEPSAPGQNAMAPARGLLWRTPALLVTGAGVFFLTFFFLSSGPQLLGKLADSRRRTASARHLLTAAEHVRRQLARYLVTIAIINVGLGVATAALAWAFGLPSPLLWGVLAGVLNFVPYAGSATTLVILTVVAILTHDNLSPTLGIAAGFLTLATIEGQVIQPLALGRRLALSPLIVFLGLWLWGWLWGVPGMLLATPILITVKAVSRELKKGGALAVFLSPARAPAIMARAREWRRLRRKSRRVASQDARAAG